MYLVRTCLVQLAPGFPRRVCAGSLASACLGGISQQMRPGSTSQAAVALTVDTYRPSTDKLMPGCPAPYEAGHTKQHAPIRRRYPPVAASRP